MFLIQWDRNVSGSTGAKKPEEEVPRQMCSPEVGSWLGEDAASREAARVSSPKPAGKGQGCAQGAACQLSAWGAAVAPPWCQLAGVGGAGAGMLLNSLPSFGMCWPGGASAHRLLRRHDTETAVAAVSVHVCLQHPQGGARCRLVLVSGSVPGRSRVVPALPGLPQPAGRLWLSPGAMPVFPSLGSCARSFSDGWI